MKTVRYITLSMDDVDNLILDYTDILGDDNDSMLCIKSYLRGLDRKSQTIFVLFAEGYTSRTIAAYLDISHTTVQNYIKRMTTALSECGRD